MAEGVDRLDKVLMGAIIFVIIMIAFYFAALKHDGDKADKICKETAKYKVDDMVGIKGFQEKTLKVLELRCTQEGNPYYRVIDQNGNEKSITENSLE